MKKLLGIIVLGLLFASCSEQSRITKKVESCADHSYQEYWVEKNQGTQKEIDDFVKYEFNKAVKNETGPFKPSENTDSLKEQVKDFDNYKKKIRDFQNVLRERAVVEKKLVINDFYKSRLKKSLKEKLKFKGYETDFQWCEYKRSDSPLAFDNKW